MPFLEAGRPCFDKLSTNGNYQHTPEFVEACTKPFVLSLSKDEGPAL
jgi:hypothetical protein